MPSKSKRKPSYLLHKPTGQARVRIDGHDHYLGAFGSPESRERYDDLIREWCLRNGDVTTYALTVDDLCLRFLDEAERTYRHPDGTPTGTARNFRESLRPLIRLYGTSRVRDFGPLKLKAVRDEMVRAGQCRTNINRHVARVRQVFKWGVENELVPSEVYQALAAVSGLRKGRAGVRESAPVAPVPDEVVEATLPHLPRVVADMVRLQLLTGARPGEVCRLRPCDVTRGIDGVWTYRPERHKTEHHEKDRRIFIGPRGQAILAPYLDGREPETPCFSPAEAEAQHNEKRKAARRSPMTPSQAARKRKGRKLRDGYTKDSYNRAVQRACEAAFGMPPELRNPGRGLMKIPEAARQAERERRLQVAAEWRAEHCWSPNQLRHSTATTLREQFGIEAAQVVLGHSDPKTTLIYAEAQFRKAAEIVRQIG